MLTNNLPKVLTFDGRSGGCPPTAAVPVQVSTQTQLTLRPNISAFFCHGHRHERMAIAMAQQGGIGIVHRNLTIEQQAGQ